MQTNTTDINHFPDNWELTLKLIYLPSPSLMPFYKRPRLSDPLSSSKNPNLKGSPLFPIFSTIRNLNYSIPKDYLIFSSNSNLSSSSGIRGINNFRPRSWLPKVALILFPIDWLS